MSKKSLRVLVGVAGAFALTLSLLSPAGADHKDSHTPNKAGNEDNVCPPTHQYPDEDDSLTIEAPEGEVILWYCIKAGSAKQGDSCGPVTVTFDDNYLTSVDLTTVCAGRAISHYSYGTGPEPPSPPPEPEATTTTAAPTTTEAPEPEPEPEPAEDPSGVLGAGAANAQVGAPSFTG